MAHPRHDPSSRCGLARAVATHPVRIDVTEPTAAHRDPSAMKRLFRLRSTAGGRAIAKPA
jgi:ABC-type transporter Mla maintaining outer membrane lipid asymmetry ATPase subunit MlaF